MNRGFNKPLNQMTEELYEHFRQLRSQLEDDSTCECNNDETDEDHKMSDALLGRKHDCKHMDILAEKMIAELGQRNDLGKEWQNGYKKCITNLRWLSSKLAVITEDNLSDHDLLTGLKSEISKKSYEINNFVSSLQKTTEYDFRYTKTLNGKNHVLQCVEIPKIKVTISKEKGDAGIMASQKWLYKKNSMKAISAIQKKYPNSLEGKTILVCTHATDATTLFLKAISDLGAKILSIPKGTAHKVTVTSKEKFSCLVIASPPFSFWDQFFQFPDKKHLK